MFWSMSARTATPRCPPGLDRETTDGPCDGAAARAHRLAAENALLRRALESMPVGLTMYDADDRVRCANARAAEIWSVPPEVFAPGTPYAEFERHVDRVEIEHSVSRSAPLGTRGRRKREYRTADGRAIEVFLDLHPDGTCTALHDDVTEKREHETRIAFLARHDALTGLPNRTAFRAALERALAPGAGTTLALLYLDLDRFKAVNDTLGHLAGDELLKLAAERLRACTRDDDLVARLGGDEFVILQLGLPQPASSEPLAERVVTSLSRPFHLDGRRASVGVSVGVAIAGSGDCPPDELLGRADEALYRAKDGGRGTWRCAA